MTPSAHIPVLAREAVDGLSPRDGGVYIDATFGRGGYTSLLLDAARCRVIGIDRDPEAVALGQSLAQQNDNFRIEQGAFGDMASLVGERNIDGIAFDLGVSSPQLDDAARGFSFRLDGPLDMRMSGEGDTAADIVNTMDENNLADLIYQYGEERASRKIARAIVVRRKEQPFTRTRDLAELIAKIVPKTGDTHPATKTFQALRIAVNDELGELQRGLEAAENMLAPQGRLAVVTFHSLEDRIVKNFLRERSGRMPAGSRHRPAIAAQTPVTFRLLHNKAVTPGEDEIRNNPRARSAKLRLAERVGERHAS